MTKVGLAQRVEGMAHGARRMAQKEARTAHGETVMA